MDRTKESSMSDESERRLKKVMDKLYHFPNPKASPSSSPVAVETSRRAELSTRFGMEKGLRVPRVSDVGPTPPCRPWDRGDLMRRLATFKAMTWFAKPKVISPVNCARRGWVNEDRDTISCEACGARLMFSTPTSWTLQQVDKVAAVFSLKLDSGHKLLCPWTDNICEESLVLFPPTPPSVLIRNYEDCISSLLQLSSLPKISSSALSYMKKTEPRLEEFLKEQHPHSVLLKGTIRITESAQGKDLEGLIDDSDVYYEALKLIGLCGWRLHQLPYAIDRVKQASQKQPTTLSESSKQELTTVSFYSSTGNDDGGTHHDPSSFILECNLCGARAALWPFTTVEKPLRLYNLEENSSKSQQVDASKNCGNSRIGGGLNASIGGGPPATRQNFRPTVSLPFISRHLRPVLQGFGGLERKRKRDDSSREEGMEAAPAVTDKQNTNGSSESLSGKHVLFDKLDELDPMMQHRTFCPWICHDSSGQTLPGWKLMLSALLAQKEKLSHGEEAPQEENLNQEQSSLLDEVDDPVASVRRLFMASPSKRLKSAP